MPDHHHPSPPAWAGSPPAALPSPGNTRSCWTASRPCPIHVGPRGAATPLAFVLALAACAVLAGAKSLTAIAEWAADAPAAVLTTLGGPSREPTGPTAPTEATVRRILQRVDGDALDAAIGAWLAAPGRSSRWS
ncbi:transposase family protein [Kitasatospora sp. NPDC051164]|uniref:transposase family protein n=1 Tax=Kitasatospora sp. NPDC051164 TaxID=3364055 RepID=UPI0037985684